MVDNKMESFLYLFKDNDIFEKQGLFFKMDVLKLKQGYKFELDLSQCGRHINLI